MSVNIIAAVEDEAKVVADHLKSPFDKLEGTIKDEFAQFHSGLAEAVSVLKGILAHLEAHAPEVAVGVNQPDAEG